MWSRSTRKKRGFSKRLLDTSKEHAQKKQRWGSSGVQAHPLPGMGSRVGGTQAVRDLRASSRP